MKEELLQEFKKELEKKREEIEENNNKIIEAKELESNIFVKRYLELCGTDSMISTDYQKLDLIKEFNSFVRKINAKETNGIYVYCGTYRISVEDKIIRTKRNDKGAWFREYWDIEQQESKRIPIDRCEEFEKDNIVIQGVHFNAVRKLFIKTALESGQEEAVKTIVKKYKNRNN